MVDISILIALGSNVQNNNLRNLLLGNGYYIINIAESSQDCIRKVRALKPDVTIIDYELSNNRGLQTANIIVEESLSSVVFLCLEKQLPYLSKNIESPDLIPFAKPINKELLINTIQVLTRNLTKVNKLRKEISELKESLETRKRVEQAKALLIEKKGITENEAYKMIQKDSMDTGRTMLQTANDVINAINSKI